MCMESSFQHNPACCSYSRISVLCLGYWKQPGSASYHHDRDRVPDLTNAMKDQFTSPKT